MIKIEADLHVHSMFSGHAYSTIDELAEEANNKGLKMIALTDHGPALPGGTHFNYFNNLKVLPEKIKGVRILRGIEANILNDGSLDLAERYFRDLNFVACGIHMNTGYTNTSVREHTRATINAIKNPLVDMVTHPINLSNMIDLEEIVQAAKEYDVILEINASSHKKIERSRGDKKLSRKLIKLALKNDNLLALNSDAHYRNLVGDLSNLEPVVGDGLITNDNIINSSMDRVLEFLEKKNKVNLSN